MRRALVAGLVAATLVSGTATATKRGVSIKDDGFLGTSLTVYLNDEVSWRNQTSHTHNVTAKRFGLFKLVVAPDTYSPYVMFKHAGAWWYTCTDHPNAFSGVIKVLMNKQPSSGTTTTIFAITVATENAPTGFRHDVQKRKVGQSWASWKTTQGFLVTFDPSTPGTYEFRGRLRRMSDGKATGWSPTLQIQVS
jgi:plastocyanin